MTWTKSGSVNLTNGNAVVYGTGTAWVSGGMARPGDVFIAPGGDLYEVASIQSNTQLTLSSLYLGSTASGQSYSLIHTGLLPAELAINLSSLQSKYLTTISQLWEWETSNAATVPLTNPATGVTTNVKPITGLVLAVDRKAPIDAPNFTGNATVTGTLAMGSAFESRNKIINGAMLIAQRGVVSVNDLVTYTLDRWIVSAAGAALTVGQTPGTGEFKYALNIVGATGNTYAALTQRIESANAYFASGTVMTVRANIYCSSSRSVSWIVYAATSSDNWSNQTIVTRGSLGTLANGWNVVTYQFTTNASCQNSIAISFEFGAVTSGNVGVTGVQLEVGSLATPFAHRPYGVEYDLCRRYFRTYATSQNTSDLALSMRGTPTASGSGPYYYSSEI